MQKVKLNIVPKGVKKTTYLSQNDNGRVVRYELFNELIPYILDGSETITVKVVRPDGEEILSSIENTFEGKAYIDVNFNDDMSAIAGVGAGEIKITDGETELGSHNFDLNIERDAYGEDITVETAQGVIATFTTGVIDNLVGLKTTFEPKQDLHGYPSPWPAGGGKNKFDYSQATSTAFSNNTGVFTNVIADTRENFSFQIQAFNVDTLVTQTLPMTITSTGRHSQTITIDQPITRLTIKHNGSQQDIRIYYPFTTLGTFTISIDVLGYNPTVIGGLSFKNVQIEAGSVATDYEPYSNICEIEGIDSITFNRTGVNLVNPDALVSGWLLSDGSIDPSTTNYKTTDFIKVNPSDTYFITETGTSRCKFYDENKQPLTNVFDGNINGNRSETFTVSSAARYIRKSVSNTKIDGFTINYPATETEYKAYTGESALVEIGQEVYGGYYDKDLGIVLNKKLVDLGSLSWISEESEVSGLARAPETDVRAIGAKYNQTPISSAFKGVAPKGYLSFNDGEIAFSNSDIHPFLRIRSSIFNGKSNAEIKALLNGYTLCYELETPIIIPADAVNFETVKGVNNVWSDTNGETEVKFFVKES